MATTRSLIAAAVAHSAVLRRLQRIICFFNLTTTKWRFISLPDALNILRVSTVPRSRSSLDYAFIFGASTSSRRCRQPHLYRTVLVPPGVRA
jgi:hypothetical protein